MRQSTIAIILLALAVCLQCGAPTRAPDAGAPEAATAFRSVSVPPADSVQRANEKLGARGMWTPITGPRKLGATKPVDPYIRRCVAKEYPDGWAGLAACIAGADVPQALIDAGHRLGDFLPSATPNPAWAIPDWYVASTGNDHNTCVTSGSPCKTRDRIFDRWGGQPALTTATTIHDLTDQAITDPLFWNPVELQGSAAYVIGSLSTFATIASIGTVTPKNRATGQALTADLGAGASTYVGLMAHNTTHDSYAWVDSIVSGNVAKITQPFVSNTPAAPTQWTIEPNEVDTWATSDAVTILQPVHDYLAGFHPVPFGDLTGTGGSWLGNEWITDTTTGTGTGQSLLSEIFGVSFSQVRIDPLLQGTSLSTFTNTFILDDASFVNAVFIGGRTTSLSSTQGASFAGSLVDGDAMLHANITFGSGTQPLPNSAVEGNNVQIGSVYSDSGQIIVDTGQTKAVDSVQQVYGAATLYGSYTIGSWPFHHLHAGVLYYPDPATSFFQGSVTLQLSGATTATAVDLTHDFQMLGKCSLIVANLDTAVSSGGCGGVALSPDLHGGFVNISKVLTPPSTSAFFVAGSNITLTGCTPGSSCTIAATGGGTVTGSGTAHDVAVWSSSSALGAVAGSTNGQPLLWISGSADPTFAPLNLSGSGVTSTLGHGNGGTDVTSPGANGNVLTSNGTNWTSAAPAFTGWPSNQCDVNSTGLFTASGAQVTLCSFTLTTTNATQKNLIVAEFGAGVGSASAFSYTAGVAIGGCGSPTFIEPTLTPMFNSGGVTMWANGGVTLTDAPGAATTTTYCAVMSASAAGPGTAVIGSMTGHTIPQ